MARKYDFISELYNRTCKMVVANPESWEAFLRSACYNYRLRFDEQLLVHAQRPDATAVLQIDDWNQKFGRWVNRGAHGIAVFEDADQRRQRLVHYYNLLTSCTLNEHLNDTERRATEMEQLLTEQMAASEGVTESLKAMDMMSWVRKMNSIKSRVQEIVMAEVIFA